jgi:hypothetical protein
MLLLVTVHALPSVLLLLMQLLLVPLPAICFRSTMRFATSSISISLSDESELSRPLLFCSVCEVVRAATGAFTADDVDDDGIRSIPLFVDDVVRPCIAMVEIPRDLIFIELVPNSTTSSSLGGGGDGDGDGDDAKRSALLEDDEDDASSPSS